MPRPSITKKVQSLPKINRFGPNGPKRGLEVINMTIEEYETIRLIDEKGLNQAQCAEEMGVGRTTAQRIYNNARKKIAECLVYGKVLQIEGGDYVIRGRQNRGHHGQGMGKRRNNLKD